MIGISTYIIGICTIHFTAEAIRKIKRNKKLMDKEDRIRTYRNRKFVQINN